MRFVICVQNDGSDDLELRKVYPVLSDPQAEQDGYVRVIDESGEDYLYPESYFMPVILPDETRQQLDALVSRFAA